MKSSTRQQVAAVCYRAGAAGIEFLLVRTRGGRWIFPKGGVEAGLTQAQSAALEAFEEAGVHGRIEEMPFARYRLNNTSEKKSADKRDRREKKARPAGGREKDGGGTAALELAASHSLTAETVTAHLCEVAHLESPQEPYRMPTWFSAAKAKRRLMVERGEEFGRELANVVDRAVARIRRLEQSAGRDFANDALRKVRFEASENLSAPRWGGAAATRSPLIEARSARSNAAVELEAGTALSRKRTSYVQ